MSNTIDLESNNLCTTQDAFENFQAVSMHEENEYIALPHVVPAQPATADLTVTVKDGSWDTEVEISSTVDDQLQGVNIASKLCKSSKKSLRMVSEKKLFSRQPAKSAIKRKISDSVAHTAKKRGRKKKNANCDNSWIIGENTAPQSKKCDVIDKRSMDITESEIRDPQVSTTQETTESVEEVNAEANATKKHVVGIPNEETKTKRKRGRPKKISYDHEDVPEPISCTENILNESNSKKENQNNTVNIKKLKTRRPGRPKKVRRVVINTKTISQCTESELKTSGEISINTKHAVPENDAEEALVKFNLDLQPEPLQIDSHSEATVPKVTCNTDKHQEKNSVEKNVELSIQSLDDTKSLVEHTINNKYLNEINEKSEEHFKNAIKVVCSDDDDETDDICLSMLKKTLATTTESEVKLPEVEANLTNSLDLDLKEDPKNANSTKRNSKMPIMTDFEYNIDSIEEKSIETIKGDEEGNAENENQNTFCTSESSTGRPLRRKGKQNLHYDEGSDEDPFANVELSDDDGDPRRSKKGTRYFSDDEYIPGRKLGQVSTSDTSDSDIDKNEDELNKPKRKRLTSKGSKKRVKNICLEVLRGETSQSMDMTLTTDETSPPNEDNIDINLQSPVIKIDDDNDQGPKTSKAWSSSCEFEDFLAKKIQGTNLKIKKVSNIQPRAITPLEIPVIDPNMAKKTVDMFSQTNAIKTSTTSVQTTAPYDIPMKMNIPLSTDQSEKACEFLKDIVKTTSELGELMTQKSEDFIQKKINTKHVTDTFKMDYCVRKSFLLFKLAKHNLMQMEEDLTKQYEDFLKKNDLLQYREVPKSIIPTLKSADSDSDCEIIEESSVSDSQKNVKHQEQSKFNLKTVFLNKELSIKIAKKPSEEPKAKDKMIIKGRNAVWINDSVRVKKVKPTQSFLAQDSRNKKPPDIFVTNEMVSDFFKNYYRQTALSVCAPFIIPEWHNLKKKNICCNYFYVRLPKFNNSSRFLQSSESINSINTSESETNINEQCNGIIDGKITYPKSLFSLCVQALQKKLFQINKKNTEEICHRNDNLTDLKQIINPKPLLRLCVNNIINILNEDKSTVLMLKCDERLAACINRVNSLKKLCYYKIIQEYPSTMSENSNSHMSFKSIEISKTNKLKSLFSLCVKVIQHYQNTNIEPDEQRVTCYSPKSLKHIALSCIMYVMKNSEDIHEFLPPSAIRENCNICMSCKSIKKYETNKVKSLFSLCLKVIQHNQNTNKCDKDKVKCYTPKSLKHIAFSCIIYIIKNSEDKKVNQDCYTSLKKVTCNLNVDKVYSMSNINSEKLSIDMHFINNNESHEFHQRVNESMDNSTRNYKVKKLSKICFEKVSLFCNGTEQEKISDYNSIHINSINTVPEEVFLNFQDISSNSEDSANCDNEETYFYAEDLFENDHEESCHLEECNWELKQQVKEFTSSLINSNDSSDLTPIDESNNVINNRLSIVQIKIEPLPDDIPDNEETSFIKAEPSEIGEETNFIPRTENIEVFKQEKCFDSSAVLPIQSLNISYDEDEFDTFLKEKGLVHNISECTYPEQKVFSQSSSRVRKQFEPDSDNETDNTMSLLVPQTYESLNIDKARETLMENSCSDNEVVIQKKIPIKKKIDKRRTKPKSSITKKDKDVAKELTLANEVDLLTEKMQDKIRQEEKNSSSCDSDSDSLSLSLSERKAKKDTTNNSKTKNKAVPDDEIQCSNVDSTEQISDNTENKSETDVKDTDSSPNSKRLLEYNEYVNDLYSKIKGSNEPTELNKESEEAIEDWERSHSPAINPNEPAVLLQCEPTLSFLSSDLKEDNTGEIIIHHNTDNKSVVFNSGNNEEKTETILATDQYEWKCYPVDSKDMKLYQQAIVVVEKLPVTFVDTYFRFQDVSEKDKNDIEVERLTNLQTLLKSKDTKVGTSAMGKTAHNNPFKTSKSSLNFQSTKVNEEIDEKTLTASEDETEQVNQLLPVIPQPTLENCLAKNTLMEEDNDTNLLHEVSIKEEPKDIKQTLEIENCNTKLIPERKIKSETNKDHEPLMLTADKMMNKELTLLHKPVMMDDDVNNSLDQKSSIKTYSKRMSKTSGNKDHIKMEDHSSSEEEKQWVNSKQKRSKRLEKKLEDSRIEDAKRAKRISEFIEKCEAQELRKRHLRGRGTRSRKTFLERQKQLSVLSKELFGESSSESPHLGKKGSQTLSKGRRNIRKVIDKKSLARSTVIANVEENERKRRLIMRQTRLRELLGCEEGVNVLVINDEVCLEYDFEELRPTVTIHPFFTKVMKAHQYEGVKFMWDACFESLDKIQTGHPGGGCILAHCMGLGKTLQVLALLHTVLTHPRVGIQRVLVCCPLSTVLNWVDEIHKWIGPVTDKIKVFELSKLKKTYERAYQLEDWYNGGGIFIIGYELFRNLTTLDPIFNDTRPTIVNKIRRALLNPGPDIIVCDEGHLLKNDSSVLAVAMSRVATKRRIVLTGTPMQNNLREYYCMVNFVKPNLLGRYSEYSNRFENPIMNGQHRDSREEDIKLMKARTYILHKVLEGCLQRQEASVLYPYLPKKHEYTVFIPLTKCQSDLYKHYLAHYTKVAKQSILRDFHILQKIWTHPQVLHNFQMKSRDDTVGNFKVEKLEDDLAREDLTATEDIKPTQTEVWWLQYLEGGDMLNSLESSNKFLTVFRILDECIALGDKVLIFSTSLFTMDTLEYFLKRINNWSLGREYYRLDGSVPPEVRQKWCREFNADINKTTKLFLISTRAGSLGLNMTAANRVIILDTSWNPAHDIQSIFRVYRFGQKKDCYIYRLVALGTMEQKIYERAVTKQAIACRVVDEQQIDRHYNMDELTELYNLDESGAGVAGGVAVGVTDVALLRVAREAALYAVHEHDSLLRGSAEQQLPEHERAAAWLQFEQEQAHTQMKNLGTKPFQMPIKQPLEHDYAKSSYQCLDDVITEKTETPDKEKVELKSKICRKSSFRDRILLKEEPSTSQQNKIIETNKKEMSIIQKIKDILVQHHFQNQHEAIDVTDLVANVRKLVEAGLRGSSSDDDGNVLTKSIAEVLIQSESSDAGQSIDIMPETMTEEPIMIPIKSTSDLKPVTNDEKGDYEKVNEKKYQETKKRQKKRKWIDDTEDQSSSHLNSDNAANKLQRQQRMAALKAKKHIDSIASDITHNNADDDDWSLEDNSSIYTLKRSKQEQTKTGSEPANAKGKKIQVEDTIETEDKEETSKQEKTVKKQTTVQEKTVQEETSKLEKTVQEETSKQEKTVQEETTKQEKTVQEVTLILESNANTNSEMDSILLSDDDDDVIIQTKEPESCQITKDQDEEDNELVPLHKSILTNPNFIKIVAHTYLEGNKMLDVDAALLAAQYSTQKLLKEIEMTGKDVYSGPIYDIAVKAVSKEMLKKLHSTHNKTDQSKVENANVNRLKNDKRKMSQTEIGLPKVKQSKLDQGKSKQSTVNKAKVNQSSGSQNEYDPNLKAKQIPERKYSSDSDDLVLISGDASFKGSKSDSTKKVQEKKKYIPEQEQPENLNEVKTKVYTSKKKKMPISSTSAQEPSTELGVSPRVVPIGLIKRSTHSSALQAIPLAAECILPDTQDDDDHAVNEAPSSTRGKPLYLKQYNAQQFFSNKVSASTKTGPSGNIPSSTHETTVPSTISYKKKETTLSVEAPIIISDVDVDNTNTPVPVTKTTVTLAVNRPFDTQTICLDSDEEEDTAATCQASKKSTTSAAPNVSQATPKLPLATPVTLATESPNIEPSPSLASPKINTLSSSPNLATDNTRVLIPMNKLHTSLSKVSFGDDPKHANSVERIIVPLNNNFSNATSPNVGKRLCKPGDIIRISGNGKIVVLNKKNTTLVSTSKESNPLGQEKIIPDKTLPTTKKEINVIDKNKVNKQTDKVEDTKLLQAEEGRSLSPDNPLTVIKNVVQIQADAYDNTDDIRNNKETVSNNEINMQTNANIQTRIPSLPKDSPVIKLANPTTSSMKLNKSLSSTSNFSKLHLTASLKNKLVKNDTKKKPIVQSLTNTNAPKQTNSAIANSIDLTNNCTDDANSKNKKMRIVTLQRNSELKWKNTLTMSHKSVAKKCTAATVSNSSKEIAIARALEKASEPPSVDLTTESIVSSSAKISDIKKRLPAPETSSKAKKIKSELFKQLTLEDFDIDDIDDIDDIIELD